MNPLFPRRSNSLCTLAALTLVWGGLQCPAFAQADLIPQDSRIASASPGLQRLLLSPLDAGSVLLKSGDRMNGFAAGIDEGVAPKVGEQVLKISGIAMDAGGKGDFVVASNPPGETQQLGCWVHLSSGANVSEVGLQVTDAEGELLMARTKADWEGWKWIEFGLLDDSMSPAFRQEGKSGKVEFPLKSVHIIWFATKKGPSSLGVDGLIALSKIESPGERFGIASLAAPWGETGKPFQGKLLVHNYSDKEAELKVTASLQSNPDYQVPSLPHPVRGSDHALGRPTWFEMGAQRIDNPSLTDGDDESHYHPTIPKQGVPEIFSVVELDRSRAITSMAWRAGDANWIHRMDVSASEDGIVWTPVDGLQNLDLHQKWNLQTLDLPKPFAARFVRLRYHNGEGNLSPFFRTLASLSLYDGLADETISLPKVGREVANETVMAKVPARSFQIVALKPTPALGPDAYLFGQVVEEGNFRKAGISDYFVMPAETVALRPESRFGMNASNPDFIPLLARAGFGWVRFENMKWRFYHPKSGEFRFDGSVAPWHVPLDDFFRRYQEAGMSILPYIFETPKWATTAPPTNEKNNRAYPPQDNKEYAEAIYQAVARYGSAKVTAEKLLTPDKLTGLNRINTYELWNEPNLNDPGWGFFAGPLDAYYPLFRAGAEAAKKADPAAKVTNGGWAGLSMEWVDTMRTFKYPDGKTPLDFTDVLSVHFYAGKDEPESATKDPNAFREGAEPGDIQTLEKDMIDLADWRDELKPQMPIWVTETGHDVGGPIGRTERHQAAKLPRGAMLSFANGMEKVFLYRESGSTPAHHAGAGLMRSDASLRASYFTMATLIRQLDGVTETRVPRLQATDPKVWMYSWKRPGGDVLTAWAPEGEGTLGLDLGRCKVTNAFGAESEQTVGKDFRIGYFPVYISRIGNAESITALRKEADQREEERRKLMAFQSKAETLLFDFGSREFIGTKKVGKIRAFTPVLREDAYDEKLGYGFAGQVTGKNNFAHWIRSPLEKDSIQLHQPAIFKVRAKPGTYEVRFKGENFREGAELQISVGRDGVMKIPVPPGKDAKATGPQILNVADGQLLEFQFPAGNLQWLTLIETSPVPAR